MNHQDHLAYIEKNFAKGDLCNAERKWLRFLAYLPALPRAIAFVLSVPILTVIVLFDEVARHKGDRPTT